MRGTQQEFLILEGPLLDYNINTIVEILNIQLKRAVASDIKLKRPSTYLLEEAVNTTIEIHPLTLVKGIVYCKEQIITLYPSVLKLLYILAQAQGTIVLNRTLARLLWPDDLRDDTKYSIKKNISNLRKALSPFIEPKEYIKTIPGLGYILVTQEEVSSNGVSNNDSLSQLSPVQLENKT
ncbi:hypothetical protein LCGC14_0422260 [marine sediment metagenome]|uniref:OmpR/PhoB-type domain-containing protein n=1 Tax=marine sediment metagenome TaxID=412755 RepID=A0A0F9VCN2_9ZZZZ